MKGPRAPAGRARALAGAVLAGAVLAAAAAASLAAAAGLQPVQRGLTAPAAVARAYDAILDARFDDVPDLLANACGPPPGRPQIADRPIVRTGGPAPGEACDLLEAVAVWWRIQLDPYDTGRDALFQANVAAALASSAAWTVREPQRAEAWLYRGGAAGARAQWLSLRGERLAAAREGARIKEALERATTLDPAMADAYFGLGLYHYYADVAPAALRALRWLLLLPGGDRRRGLHEMLTARQSGQLFRSEADYQLHVVYVWYEKRYGEAIELLRGLQARHPRNPHFPQAIAEIQDFHLDDTGASLRTWEALREAADAGRIAEPQLARANARLGIAAQLDQLGQFEAAVEELDGLIASRPTAPRGIIPRAHYQLGQALQHAGRPADAAAAYRAAIESSRAGGPAWIPSQARSALRAIERARASTRAPQ